MKFPALLLVATIICYIKHQYQMTQQSLPTDLTDWCPYSNFCVEEVDGINRSKVPKLDKDVMPCCSSCSCSKDCGRKRNCCKYEYDLYKLDETLETVCKKLLLYKNLPNEPYYHIVYKCPNRSVMCVSGGDNGQAGYSPVYSKTSGMIYYNEKCAKCHNQFDLERFSQMFTCEKQSTSYFSSLYSSHGCTLRFRPPNNIDLSTEICYPFLNDECHQKTESDEFVKLCNSFNATFHTKSLIKYRNVFCYFCALKREINADNFFRTLEFCPVEGRQKDVGDIPFAILLDSNRDLRGNKEGVEGMNREFCTDVNGQVECRPLYCPEGQVYIDGQCQVLGKQWYFSLLRINVKLVPVTGHKKCLVSDLPEDRRYNTTNFNLLRPGLQGSKIALYYNVNNDNVTVRSFLAMLLFEKITVNPTSFLKRIRTSLRTDWTLHINNSVFILTPMIGKYIRYEQVGNTTGFNLSPAWFLFPIYFGEEILKRRSLEIINIVGGNAPVDLIELGSDAVFITKLYFCNLVELYGDQIGGFPSRLALKNGTTYLEDGEFTWIETEEGMQTTRVCLQDVFSYSGTALREQFYSLLLVCFVLTYFITK